MGETRINAALDGTRMNADSLWLYETRIYADLHIIF
jgi:hypothetical protein